jgi:peptide chain release factor 1
MIETLDSKLEAKLRALQTRYEELGRSLAVPGAADDRDLYRSMAKTYAELAPIVVKFGEYLKAKSDLQGARDLVASADDPDMRFLASDEARELERRLGRLQEELRVLLLPSDPLDAKNAVLEIRAGIGGDEATLFAAEMFRMYCRYAESMGWQVRTTDVSESSVRGIKEAIAVIEGDRVYSRLKYESGVHRVQRVPETEAQGRIHTSAVTVAVLPEADDVEVAIDDKDLRIDTFCSSGPGGQSVNTTQSAVRITHLPSGIVVQCQDEKSWHKNKARAMQVLRSRLYDQKLREQQDAIARERRGMIRSGDRSEKIRSYNFPQNRVTDHRIGLTLHNLASVLDGELSPIVDALAAHDRAERLERD